MNEANNYDYSRSDWERAIDEWVFSERDRAVLKRRLLDGIKFEALAEEFDLTPRQVQRIVYRSQEKVFRKLK